MPEDECEHGEDLICEQCAERCADCRTLTPPDELEGVGAEFLCSNCVFTCIYCGSGPMYIGDGFEVEEYRELVCNDCARYCDHCNVWSVEEHDHEDEDEDEDDLFAPEGLRVHSYGYKPEPLFFGDTDNGLFFGVEHEMEFPSKEAAEDALVVARKACDRVGDAFYVKQDGSLSRWGFELVSHPFSRRWFDERYPVDMLVEMQALGASPKDTYGEETAGIHIHVSKDAFSAYHLYKFMHFHYEFAGLVQRLAGRTDSHFASFNKYKNGYTTRRNAAGEIVMSYESKMRAMASKKATNPERYMALNLRNEDTVELRYFRSTAKIERLRAYVQFVDAVYHYTNLTKMSKKAIGKRIMSERDFLAWLRDNALRYPDTVALLVQNPAYSPD